MGTKLRFYSTNMEEEKRIKISKARYDELVREGLIYENKTITITQYWLNVVEEPVRMRIRHTRDITSAFHVDVYEHTVKYPVAENVDLEITSELSGSGQYDLIKSLVQNKGKDKKIRKYLTLFNFKTSADYIITADFKLDFPDEVIIEFEASRSDAQPLIIPEYLLV